MMPAGYGVDYHCLFVLDFLTSSLIGKTPPRIICSDERRLNMKIPLTKDNYTNIRKVLNTCIMQNGSATVSSVVAFPSHTILRSGSDSVKSIAPFSVTMLEKLGTKKSETVSSTLWERWSIATVTEIIM